MKTASDPSVSRMIRTSLVAACLAALPASAADILLAAFSGDAVYRYDGVSATLFATDPAMDGPTALAYNSAGHLLVLNEFSHNVLEFNGTTGAFISTLISSAALGAAGILDPNDMEVGPDGNLYISSHFNDGGINVVKFNATTGASLGVFASTLSPTHHTHGLAFDAAGNLYQGNLDGLLVEKFDGVTGASMGTFASAPGMTPIGDLVFGPANLYVTTTGGAGVARFTSTGSLVDYLPTTAGSAYWGAMVDSGTLYLSNLSAGTLRKFDATTGAFIGDIALGGGAFDMIAMPTPEPGRAALLLVGIAMMTAVSRRRTSP